MISCHLLELLLLLGSIYLRLIVIPSDERFKSLKLSIIIYYLVFKAVCIQGLLNEDYSIKIIVV
jgi:hypothetical protein